MIIIKKQASLNDQVQLMLAILKNRNDRDFLMLINTLMKHSIKNIQMLGKILKDISNGFPTINY